MNWKVYMYVYMYKYAYLFVLLGPTGPAGRIVLFKADLDRAPPSRMSLCSLWTVYSVWKPLVSMQKANGNNEIKMRDPFTHHCVWIRPYQLICTEYEWLLQIVCFNRFHLKPTRFNKNQWKSNKKYWNALNLSEVGRFGRDVVELLRKVIVALGFCIGMMRVLLKSIEIHWSLFKFNWM